MTNTELLHLPKRISPAGPRVTVVMPTYRRSTHIGATLRSLLAGQYTDFELLVRDDGNGQDGTYEAVTLAAQGDQRVRYYRNEHNVKMPGNLNSGILEARGELIAVCHDHDLYKPDFLATLVDTLDRHPSALFVHSAIEVIGQDGRYLQIHIGDWDELTPGVVWLRVMLESLSCPVCALTLVRREAHERYGLYDSAYGFISDVEMWMRLARQGDVAYVKTPLIQVRDREEDHIATKESLRWIRTVGQIHRHYLPHAYAGWLRIQRRLRLEKNIFIKMACELLAMRGRSFLNRVRQRNISRASL